MTHKPPQGIDAALSYCARCNCRRYRNVEGKCEVCALYQTQRAAPPDPRKDLAALEEAARKVELSVEEVRQLTLKSWPREHSNPPDVEEWRATIAALIRNNIDLKYALAEMRGVKR